MSADPVWDGAQYVERWAGEVRVNLLRIVALAAFYGWHLFNYLNKAPDLTPQIHFAITAACLVWGLSALAVHLALNRRYCPPALRYGAIAMDALMATTVLLVADGPKSPLVVVYFLVVASAALRLDLKAVWVAVLAAVLGYATLCGQAKWRRPEMNVPRRAQVTVALALGCAGLVAGQMVRQAKRLARDYGERLTAKDEEAKA
ncbi:MAG: hypothetical protein FD180_1487 [Planctomycetota bacterium]|nr:MAG: hypothetical protein FD180_1487 [Planctomycetota bacterium]